MRLAEQTRSELTSVASKLVKRSSVVALCAYGSMVAGYSRPDSDYDLIVVVDRFREGVRYRYVEEPFAASALIVSETLLDGDAKTSSLGEFVVGRFLNIYEPIYNPELFKKVEIEYKKRVLTEALLELSSDYGDFSKHLIIPYDYFLFDKLKKRSAVYPPAVYSYVQTYTCPLASENRAFSVDGFKVAAEALAPRGFLTVETSSVRLHPERLRGDAFTKVQQIFNLTTRGVTQYAVHGYAGRVGLSVFRSEAESKLKRMREKPEPLPELERPRGLLSLEEGTIISDASRLQSELARKVGLSDFHVQDKLIGDPYSTTRVLMFRGEGREESLVVKNFSDVRSLKWAVLGLWAAAASRFSMTPMARLEREYAMTRTLRAGGVNVPRIMAVAPDERILVKEFIGGPTLASVIDNVLAGDREGLQSVSSYGRLLAQVHSAGLALGDAKASNVVVSPRGLFLTDLEQAVPGGDEAWDIAEFLYYTAKLSAKEGPMKLVAGAFLSAYRAVRTGEAVAKAHNAKYLRPFQPFLTPGMTKAIRDVMEEYS